MAITTAVAFDGTNDYLDTASLTAQADGPTASFYIKIKVPVAGATKYILNATTPNSYIYHASTGKIRCVWFDNAGSATVNFTSSSTYSDEVIEIFIAIDTNGSALMYINGVSEGTDASQSGNNYDMTPATGWGICAQQNGGSKIACEMYRITMWDDVALDVTNATVRSNMADETQGGTLGNNIIDFYGLASVWNAGTNQGSGGSMTMNGAVTDVGGVTTILLQATNNYYR